MELFQRAQNLAQKGRPDAAAIFFAAASSDESGGLNDATRYAARVNAAVLAEKVGSQRWGATLAEFVGDLRHEAVCDAVAAAASGGRRVLILGSALGAYAVAAKKSTPETQVPAGRVVCCEGNALLHYIATLTVQTYELDDVLVTDSEVTELDSTEGPFDVLVAAERCWGSTLTDEGLRELASALPLLAPGASIIPEAVSVWAQAFESDTLKDFNHLDVDQFRRESGLDYTLYNDAARRSRIACHLSNSRAHRAISPAKEWLSVDLRHVVELGEKGSDVLARSVGTVELEIQVDGRLDSFVTWSSIRLPGAVEALSWGPGSPGATSWQYAHYPKLTGRFLGYAVTVGSKFVVPFQLASDGVWAVDSQAPGDSNFCSPYHTSMLAQDPQRTRAYRLGIERAVHAVKERIGPEKAVNVLDIGAGTGLLSSFAARAGAEVVACERGEAMASLARKIIDANEAELAAGKVSVVHALSTDLMVEDVQPHLVVSEIFGTDPLSESVLPSLRHVSEKLTGGGRPLAMLPCRCRVWGVVARVPSAWESRTVDASSCGIDFGELLMPFESGVLVANLRDDFSGVKACTEPTILVTHSLTPPIHVSGSCSASVRLLAEPQPLYKMLALPPPSDESGSSSNEALCVLLWWDADCSHEPSDDPETRISTSPEVKRAIHWSQYVQILHPRQMGEGVLEAVLSGQGSLSIRTTWKVDRTEIFVERAHA